MSEVKVSYKRHLAKTISYRIISPTIGVLGMWYATGSFKWGATFGVVELVYKPLQYYIHERVWYKYIKFGVVEIKKPPKPKKTTEEEPVSELKEKKTKRLNYSSNR